MAKVLINETSLSGIADAIRAKNGSSDTYKPSEMAAAIEAIEAGGGGGGDLPEEALTITGDCSSRFAANGWNWFIEQYGDQVTTKDITEASNMFYGSSALTEIPFDLHFAPKDNRNDNTIYNLFYNCTKLTQLPKLTGKKASVIPTYAPYFMDLDELFGYCANLREIPDDYLDAIVPEGYWEARRKYAAEGNGGNIFNNCYSLRKHCSLLPFAHFYNGSYYYSMYSSTFKNCYALDSIYNLPAEPGEYSSNAFSQIVASCYRLKDFTFEMQADGTPYVVKWKSQTIDLTSGVGYANSETNIIRYNSGITADKQVADDASYQALKNDPDWFTTKLAYARYNHDSAVATINSLPDTSAYLATAGGTNTIKFRGACGSATDGGAINTLTEEEIAVATAKGWTVTLV